MPEEQEAKKTQDSPKEQSPQNTEGAQNKQEKPQEASEAPKKAGGFKQYLIPAAVLLVMVAAGFVVGKMLGRNSGPKEAKASAEKPAEKQTENILLETSPDAKGWYYDLEPIATNLNEPGATRYVRVLLTLEMSSQVDQLKGVEFLNERKPIMINLMNIYFAGLSIEDLNSDKDIRRIQSELIDIFNENLYPNAKPLIKKILFKEFGIQ